MGSFIKGFTIKGRSKDFSFIRVFTTNGVRYYVTVVDGHAKPYLFHMEKRSDNTWRIVDAPKVPEWIHHIEAELGKAIEVNENK